jgi:hypothetical protein
MRREFFGICLAHVCSVRADRPLQQLSREASVSSLSPYEAILGHTTTSRYLQYILASAAKLESKSQSVVSFFLARFVCR